MYIIYIASLGSFICDDNPQAFFETKGVSDCTMIIPGTVSPLDD